MAALPPFQKLLDAHRTEVMRYLIAAVGPTDADDCFQETFLSALRAYPRLAGAENLRAWLLTIAHRKAIDSRRRRREVPTDAVPETGASAAPVEPSPELWGAVNELAPKQRSAVALRFACDLSYAEIGALVDSSEEAARRSVHDGLRRLREELDHGLTVPAR